MDESLKQICEGIELRYDWITFLEIGADKDHVHFLVQSTPDYSPTKIITTIKSITAKRIFAEHPEVKKQLWGGNFWSGGFFVDLCRYRHKLTYTDKIIMPIKLK